MELENADPFSTDRCYRRQAGEGFPPALAMAQFGGQKNPPWATQFTATAVSQPGQPPAHTRCEWGGGGQHGITESGYASHCKVCAKEVSFDFVCEALKKIHGLTSKNTHTNCFTQQFGSFIFLKTLS